MALRASFAVLSAYGQPQVGCDGFRPFRFGVQKVCRCLVLKVSDPFLYDLILPVGVDTAVADTLLTGRDMIAERIVGESTVVCMVMLHCHSSCLAVFLKSFLAFQGLLRSQL